MNKQLIKLTILSINHLTILHYSFSLDLAYFLIRSPFKVIVTIFFTADPVRTRKCKSCVFIS